MIKGTLSWQPSFVGFIYKVIGVAERRRLVAQPGGLTSSLAVRLVILRLRPGRYALLFLCSLHTCMHNSVAKAKQAEDRSAEVLSTLDYTNTQTDVQSHIGIPIRVVLHEDLDVKQFGSKITGVSPSIFGSDRRNRVPVL